MTNTAKQLNDILRKYVRGDKKHRKYDICFITSVNCSVGGITVLCSFRKTPSNTHLQYINIVNNIPTLWKTSLSIHIHTLPNSILIWM